LDVLDCSFNGRKVSEQADVIDVNCKEDFRAVLVFLEEDARIGTAVDVVEGSEVSGESIVPDATGLLESVLSFDKLSHFAAVHVVAENFRYFHVDVFFKKNVQVGASACPSCEVLPWPGAIGR
jgi:hypothetical protein